MSYQNWQPSWHHDVVFRKRILTRHSDLEFWLKLCVIRNKRKKTWHTFILIVFSGPWLKWLQKLWLSIERLRFYIPWINIREFKIGHHGHPVRPSSRDLGRDMRMTISPSFTVAVLRRWVARKSYVATTTKVIISIFIHPRRPRGS